MLGNPAMGEMVKLSVLPPFSAAVAPSKGQHYT
jgi:hypothetical protein